MDRVTGGEGEQAGDWRAARRIPRALLARRPDLVARTLLGCLLVHRLPRRGGLTTLVARIVEVESYHGESDAAAHAAAGRTPRTAVLFGPPGYAYVYRSYGLHACLNVSTEPEGQAGCVLIRALTPVAGRAVMERLAPRPTSLPPARLLSGPGRLTRGMGITLAENGLDLIGGEELFLAFPPPGEAWQPRQLALTRRIGITKAVEHPRRYYLESASAAVTRPLGPVLRHERVPAWPPA